MDRIRITGGRRLRGEIPISGAKNAALPLMTASLLTEAPLTLTNVPNLADVAFMTEILRQLDVGVAWRMGSSAGEGGTLELRSPTRPQSLAPYDTVRKMRASFFVLGPLIARVREATVSLPGGCAIGARPVDLHLKGLAALGAEIELAGGCVLARAPTGLKGAEFFSVGMRKRNKLGKIESYRILAGPSAGKAVNANDARTFDRGHSFGKAIENGSEITIGVSVGSKVWSNTYDRIPELLDWCDRQANKIASNVVPTTGSGLDLLPTGEKLIEVPEGPSALEVTQMTFDESIRRARFRLWPRNAPGTLPFYVTAPIRPEKSPQPISGSSASALSANSAVLVEPRQLARLHLHSPNSTMLLVVRPLQPGHLNETIRVRLVASGRTLQAKVIGANSLDAAF